jgi:hypothetical protein
MFVLTKPYKHKCTEYFSVQTHVHRICLLTKPSKHTHVEQFPYKKNAQITFLNIILVIGAQIMLFLAKTLAHDTLP